MSRAMYQALGGTSVQWTQEMTDTWLRYAAMNADLLTEPFDVIIVHDPQPLAIRSFASPDIASRRGWCTRTWTSRRRRTMCGCCCASHLEQYDAAIFDVPRRSRAMTSRFPSHVVPPAIDPNSARNMPLPDDVVALRAGAVRHRSGEAAALPGIAVRRGERPRAASYDAWQHGAGAGTRPAARVRADHGAADEPSRRLLRRTGAAMHAMSRMPSSSRRATRSGNVELNVFQRAAVGRDAEGAAQGLRALGVGRALEASGRAWLAPQPGLREQVIDGETGLVATTTDEFADAIVAAAG